jgi:hypothetical protein
VGRATVGSSDRGRVYALDGADDAVGAGLLEASKRRLGGFVEGDRDAEGSWLLRIAADSTLARWMKGHGRVPVADALRIALDLADALTAARELGVDPGAVSPDSVLVQDARAHLAAEPLVRQRLGAEPRVEDPLPLYCPPAQADGAAFDEAANVYVIGLLLTKMLTGSHPFGGLGLRRAMEAARAAAPPFPDEIARELPPGVQALTLRCLAPDVSARPSAADLALALEQLGHPGAVGAERPHARRTAPEARRPVEPRASGAPKPPIPAAPARRSAGTSRRLGLWLAPGLVAAAVMAAASTQLEDRPTSTPGKVVEVDDTDPLSSGERTADNCASCHARQANEWRRSVMGHSLKSPLFNALESLIQEQIGRDRDCPDGAGALRKVDASSACRNQRTGFAITGAGGEHWCVNCHAPLENLENRMPAWPGTRRDARAIQPVKDLVGPGGLEGIGCTFCHQTHGPVTPTDRGYQGNPTWTSFVTGRTFEARPEDRQRLFGIANSGYDMDPDSFFLRRGERAPISSDGVEMPHKRHDETTSAYLRSSEFCGSCHDVRLFGTDVIGARKGETFKRLRNGYTEWTEWAAQERRRGREPATCQDCHMSTFPGICVRDEGAGDDAICGPGHRFEPKPPGTYAKGRVALGSDDRAKITSHYFSGVDLPLSREYPAEILDESSHDVARLPVSAKARRDALLRATFRFELGRPSRAGRTLSIPLEIENVGAGHKAPAGFSQEREFWVHLTVKDARGRVVYEVGRVDRDDEDLKDKTFLRVNTDPNAVDFQGRPVGLFGADVADGPDKQEWSPPTELGGTRFTGKGLINFQNGFLRCVTCIGEIAPDGSCQPGPGQGRTRADRFADGAYDLDTGACTSNLDARHQLFETYFPVGSLDASRGFISAPDAIIDTRSAPPGVPMSFTYVLDDRGASLPLTVEARLLFRAFPPFLIRAFIEYERAMARLGKRPSGPLMDDSMWDRIEVVELARRKVELSR